MSELHPIFDKAEHDEIVGWVQAEADELRAAGKSNYNQNEIVIHMNFLLRIAKEQKKRADKLERKLNEVTP